MLRTSPLGGRSMHTRAADPQLALERSHLRIIASPAFSNETQNPYTALLYRHLERRGFEIAEFSLPGLLLGNADIWHIHWPDLTLNAGPAHRRFRRALIFLAKLLIARLRGVRVVWTVHNLKPHDWVMDRVQAFVHAAFLRSISAFISLTESARSAAVDQYPALRNVRGFVVPHGHYAGVYPDTVDRRDARSALGLPAAAKVYLFFGQIRAYKNLPALIDAFDDLGDEDSYLVIAGNPLEPEYGRRIAALTGGRERVRCDLGPIANERVQLFMRAADVVVLPYQDILNSGAALLALSFQRPVVVPGAGSMVELAAVFGERWVHTYSGELSPTDLSAAMAMTGGADDDALVRLERALEQHSWPRIAVLTSGVYRAVVEARDERLPC